MAFPLISRQLRPQSVLLSGHHTRSSEAGGTWVEKGLGRDGSVMGGQGGMGAMGLFGRSILAMQPADHT